MQQDEAGKEKENRRPLGGMSSGGMQRCSGMRRPLKPCNKRGGQIDVQPCIKWLQGTVARSRQGLTAATQSPPQSPSSKTTAAANPNAPPAQPSCSPDIIRKKALSRDLEACFGGMGPTVKGDVKDRRKSKPRALLTVAMQHKDHRPGRASLEWISSDDHDDTSSATSTDDASSADSAHHQQPTGSTYWPFSAPSTDSESSRSTAQMLYSSQDIDADVVMGAYEQPTLQHIPSPPSCASRVQRGQQGSVDALRKLTLDQFQSTRSAAALPNSYDSLSEQVRSLQMELKGLLRSESWK